jgi:hypothetical protein
MRCLLHLLDGGVEKLETIAADVPERYQDDWLKLANHLRSGEEVVNIFRVIVRNTVTIMFDQPEKKWLWADELRNIRAKAKNAGDDQMVILTKAVLTRIVKDRPPEEPLALEGPYQACWETIARELGDI